MTPKEKSKELFKNIYSKIFDIDNGANVMQDKKRFDAVKECALIAVDEILNPFRKLLPSSRNYWEQVKQEIEAL